jgi:hypothetical protein
MATVCEVQQSQFCTLAGLPPAAPTDKKPERLRWY